MIVFDLHCRAGDHRFEGWFASSQEFARQQERGLVLCPECGSPDIVKAVMAPNLGRKGNQLAAPAPRPARGGPAPQVPAGAAPASPVANSPMAAGPIPPEAREMMRALAKMQAEALAKSRWVGDTFAEDARAMHYGEREAESIHGQATAEEAKELLDEGIAVAPLPFPVTPPGKAN